MIEGETPPGGLNPGLVDASETSSDWRWRLLHGLRAFVTAGDVGPVVRLAEVTVAATGESGDRRAAVVVAAAVALMAEDRWSEADQMLSRAGDSLPPVDHGWVLVHRALVSAQQSNIAQAHRQAARALRALKDDPDDVTAKAIASAAATILISTANPMRATDSRNTSGGSMEMLDTAVSWWRDGDIAGALDSADDINFRTWAESNDLATNLSDSSHPLPAAWTGQLDRGQPVTYV